MRFYLFKEILSFIENYGDEYLFKNCDFLGLRKTRDFETSTQ